MLEIGSPGEPGRAGTSRPKSSSRTSRSIPRSIPASSATASSALGKVTMHGAVKTPTFIRLRREPLAGQTTLTLEQPVDRLEAPATSSSSPTRGSCRPASAATNYTPQDEKRADRLDRRTAGDADGAAAVRPQGRARRRRHSSSSCRTSATSAATSIVRSENPAGTRGHTMFISHADVDIRYAQFKEHGPHRMGVLNSAEFDDERRAGAASARTRSAATPIHFHHDFGPKTDAGQRLSVHADRQRGRRLAEVGHHRSTTATTGWSRTTSSTTRAAPAS